MSWTPCMLQLWVGIPEGHDNTVADMPSWVMTWLDPDMVRSTLDGIELGAVHWAKVHDPTIVEGDHNLEQEVCIAAGCTLVQMHVTDWAEAQMEDPMLSAVLDWLKAQKKTNLKTLLAEHASSEEGQLILWICQNFVIHQGALYLCSMPRGETKNLPLFVVPKAHWVTTLNGCHSDAGHPGHGHSLSLLQEHVWYLGMISQVQQSIKSCLHCLQHEGNLPKVPLHPKVATTPLNLLHIDFTSIETTLELNKLPRVANILVFQDHFMKYILAYVIPNQTAITTAKFLYQGYILILGPWSGSWVIGVLTSWVASLTKCVCSSTWRNCGPCHTTHKQMGWVDDIKW